MTVRPLSALMMASCLLVVVPAGAVFALQESPDPARAFDFEFGAWTVELSLLLEPLSGSDEWVEYRGTSVVGEVWGGEANLGELDVEGPEGRIRGLSLVSSPLREACERALSPQPEQRFQTVASLLDALRLAQERVATPAPHDRCAFVRVGCV